ncbi:unnamed protein product [Arctogadus glacialis]
MTALRARALGLWPAETEQQQQWGGTGSPAGHNRKTQPPPLGTSLRNPPLPHIMNKPHTHTRMCSSWRYKDKPVACCLPCNIKDTYTHTHMHTHRMADTSSCVCLAQAGNVVERSQCCW